ncbi:MAG TPA: S26 family signal peptidase, partial [Verrucomicrobiae bacterium]|nr:S26 family signal peptidase [Verrucomicrobiae bacterium]
MEELEFAANKWFNPYPNAVWRENVEVLLVALAVAMGIRTFFLQPFKIPTGSMQPTLYGVTSVPNFSQTLIDMRGYEENKEYLDEKANTAAEEKIRADYNQQVKKRSALVLPTGWERIRDWFEGYSYIHIVAPEDGRLQNIGKPVRFLIFNLKQTIVFNGKPITIWFPPDYGEVELAVRAGLRQNEMFRKGQDIVKIRVQSGDHLFVDRFTYNFRPPERGEIIVFDTHGITQLPSSQQDTFYIKR